MIKLGDYNFLQKNIYVLLLKNIHKTNLGHIYFPQGNCNEDDTMNLKEDMNIDKFLIFQMVLVIIGLLYVL